MSESLFRVIVVGCLITITITFVLTAFHINEMLDNIDYNTNRIARNLLRL